MHLQTKKKMFGFMQREVHQQGQDFIEWDITKYIDEVKQDFEVYGLLNGEWEYFVKDIDYTAFVVRRNKDYF